MVERVQIGLSNNIRSLKSEFSFEVDAKRPRIAQVSFLPAVNLLSMATSPSVI